MNATVRYLGYEDEYIFSWAGEISEFLDYLKKNQGKIEKLLLGFMKERHVKPVRERTLQCRYLDIDFEDGSNFQLDEFTDIYTETGQTIYITRGCELRDYLINHYK